MNSFNSRHDINLIPCPAPISRGVNINLSDSGASTMLLTKPGDEVVETWLEKLAEYETAKKKASTSWKNGYIDLARARNERMVRAFDFDGSAEAATRVNNKGRVFFSEKPIILPAFGAWPPESLKQAQRSFKDALVAEVRSLHLRKELDDLELEL